VDTSKVNSLSKKVKAFSSGVNSFSKKVNAFRSRVNSFNFQVGGTSKVNSFSSWVNAFAFIVALITNGPGEIRNPGIIPGPIHCL
jgi:hypothetical protein